MNGIMETGIVSTLALIGGVGMLIGVGVYVWYALALSRLFPRLGEQGWKGWVPILNEATILSLGGKPAWNVVFYLLPVVNLYGLYLKIVATHSINQRFGRGAGATALAVLLPPVWASLLGWGVAPYPEGDRLAALQPGPRRRPQPGAETDAAHAGATQGYLAPPILPQTPGSHAGSPASFAPPAPAAPAADAAGFDPSAPFTDATIPAPYQPATLPPASAAPLPLDDGLIDSVPWVPRAAPAPEAPAAPTPAPEASAPVASAPAAPAAFSAPEPPVFSAPQPPAFTPEPRQPVAPPEPPRPPAFTPEPPQPVAQPASEQPPAPPQQVFDAPQPPAPLTPEPPAPPVEQPAADAAPVTDAAPASDPYAPPAIPGAGLGARAEQAPMVRPAPIPVTLPVEPAAAAPAPAPAPAWTDPGAPAPAEIAPPVDGDDDIEATVIVPRRRGARRVLVLDDGRSFALSATSVVIGRNPEGAAGEQRLSIPDRTRTLSKTHARLIVQGDEWRLTDLHSTNGVVVVADDGAETLLDPGESVIGAGRFILGEVGMHVDVEADS